MLSQTLLNLSTLLTVLYVSLNAASGEITTVTAPFFKPSLIALLNKIPEEWILTLEPSFINKFNNGSNSFSTVGSPPWNVISPVFLNLPILNLNILNDYILS